MTNFKSGLLLSSSLRMDGSVKIVAQTNLSRALAEISLQIHAVLSHTYTQILEEKELEVGLPRVSCEVCFS